MNPFVVQLQEIIHKAPPLINKISAEAFTYKAAPGKWSKKELLGHLIDSATNNHQRFVRAQFEEAPAIWYDQDNWVAKNHYQDVDNLQLIEFWSIYNKHLVHVIRNIPDEKLDLCCIMKDGSKSTLRFLVADYVAHLEYHLKQLLEDWPAG